MDTRGNQLKHKTDAMAAGGTSQPIANCQHRIVSLGRSSPFVRYAWCAQCQCIQRHRPWPGVMTKSVEIGFRMEFSQQTHGCGISTGARKCANYYTTLYGCCRLVGSDVRPLSSSSSSSSSGHRIGSSCGCCLGLPQTVNCQRLAFGYTIPALTFPPGAACFRGWVSLSSSLLPDYCRSPLSLPW